MNIPVIGLTEQKIYSKNKSSKKKLTRRYKCNNNSILNILKSMEFLAPFDKGKIFHSEQSKGGV